MGKNYNYSVNDDGIETIHLDDDSKSLEAKFSDNDNRYDYYYDPEEKTSSLDSGSNKLASCQNYI